MFHVGPPEEPDRYRLGPAVAAGSEGVLYRARLSTDIGHELAVKMLNPGHHGHFDRWADRWALQTRLLAQVSSPGLVAVRECFVGPLPHRPGDADPSTMSLHVVMDWVDGEPLSWRQPDPSVPPEHLLLPLVNVGAALDLLHSGSASDGIPLIHGDVKPGNILLTSEHTSVLVDLGSVRQFRPERLTGVSGTTGYVAPEVLRAGHWSPAADRYALGCVAFSVLTGMEPPVAATAEDLLAILANAPLTRNRPELVEHIGQMLAMDPDHRPQECANWIAQLRRSSLVLTGDELKLPPLSPGRLSGESATPRRPAKADTSERTPRRSRLVALIALPTAAVAGALLMFNDDGSGPGDQAGSAVTTTTAVCAVDDRYPADDSRCTRLPALDSLEVGAARTAGPANFTTSLSLATPCDPFFNESYLGSRDEEGNWLGATALAPNSDLHTSALTFSAGDDGSMTTVVLACYEGPYSDEEPTKAPLHTYEPITIVAGAPLAGPTITPATMTVPAIVTVRGRCPNDDGRALVSLKAYYEGRESEEGAEVAPRQRVPIDPAEPWEIQLDLGAHLEPGFVEVFALCQYYPWEDIRDLPANLRWEVGATPARFEISPPSGDREAGGRSIQWSGDHRS